MRIMIVVTHLLGTGHLARALTLGRAMAAAGHDPIIVSGGMPAPQLVTEGLDFRQLPPLRSDGVDFANLLDDRGNPASLAYRDQRTADLRAIFAETTPDILITELFPFGRRNLRDEFRLLLEDAIGHISRPLICASVRDILAPPSKPAKAAFAEEMLEHFYDAVLVHSDAAVTPLQASWPVTPAIEAKLHYTGFVAPPPARASETGDGRGEILVSVGGGNVGAPVLSAAIEAARVMPVTRWRLLIGGGDAMARAEKLSAKAPENAIIEPARPDFREMLYRARASVSLCGYNTALDVLQAGCPAVFVPFDAGDEVEQSLRAGRLAERPGITVLKTAALTAESLAETLVKVTGEDMTSNSVPEMNGAARTVEILETLAAGRM